ncbi:hypothetical protein [Nonomuraea sp. SBT364]|uniref:hypothetical protein n=1 Tax=Nonomuraea sp. SBT364 TaxID=1580530 RepID=UPI0018CF9001|nr:hypothetical protein [Nonomuraea sp. SBT364]
MRGQILDEYLADHERRNGPVSEQEQDNARQAFDEVFAEDHQPILALVPEARSRGMEVEARATSELLLDAGLHGHRYAIDAVVAERALRQHRPVAMLTSDLDDMAKLCGGRVHLIAV